MKTWAVIGGGNGGQTFAGHLALLGERVRLFSKSAEKVNKIGMSNRILLKGDIEGEGRIEFITSDIRRAMKNADNIVIILPSIWHEMTAELVIPNLVDGQCVLLLPEASCGALAFRKKMQDLNCKARVIVGAGGTLPYTTRLIKDGIANVIMFKNEVEIAALPSRDNAKLEEAICVSGMRFKIVESTLRTSLDNINAMVHATPSLLNVSRIEANPPQNYEYYREGITPTICTVLERIDDERIAIANALGFEQRSLKQELIDMYSCGTIDNSLYELFQNCRSYNGIMAQKSLRTRYVLEDIPFSLVPIAALGKIAGVPTPAINTIIDLGRLMLGDELAVGRTSENLGILKMNRQQLKDVIYG